MGKVYESQSYEAKKSLIEKNNAKYEQLKFMILPEEKKQFEDLANKLNLSKVDLFRKMLNNFNLTP